VGIGTAINWVQRYRQRQARADRRLQAKKIAGPHREWLIQRCRKDFTAGLKVDCRTM
jgi:putative transposase